MSWPNITKKQKSKTDRSRKALTGAKVSVKKVEAALKQSNQGVGMTHDDDCTIHDEPRPCLECQTDAADRAYDDQRERGQPDEDKR